MNWADIWGSVIAGAIVTWPVFIAGLVIQHRKASRQLDKQTSDIRQITDQQTQTLLDRDKET